MSDKIDYDELDKAVTAAMTARKATKASKATSSNTQSNVVKNTTPTPTPRPVSRGMMIDFAPRHNTSPRVSTATKTKPQAAAPTLRRVSVRGDIITPKRPVAKATPAKNIQPKPVAPKNIATPKAAAKPQPKPVAKTPIAPASATAPKTPAPKAKATPKNIAEKAKPLSLPRRKDAPNANNYSLGGRSPFMTDAKVEKRPLGNNIPETNAAALRSTHNIYSQKSPTRAAENAKKHIIAKSPRKQSGWIWTLAVIGVIAAGGGLGFLLYLLVFSH